MRLILAILTFLTFFHQKSFSQDQNLRQITSPFLEGSTLHIKGPIGSHIYDYLSYMGQDIYKVKKISLKSYGGNHNWALEIARKIKELKVTTEITDGSFCASACVYLFGSGQERVMSKNSWIGIHGARLSGGFRLEFIQFCDIKTPEDLDTLSQDCLDFIEDKKTISLESTLKAFDLLQASSVLPTLKSYYFSLEDDPLWYDRFNVLKTRDWTLSSSEALMHNLATSIE